MYDEEIEKAILFYIIFEKEVFNLTEKDFINKGNKKIINAINELKIKKEDISMLTIKNKINSKSNKILTYISSLGEYIYKTNPDVAYKILKEKTKKREVLELAKKIQREIIEVENIDIYIEKLISALQKIELQTEKEEKFVQLIAKTAEQIEKNINKKEDFSFHTGFFDLDKLTDGLHEGELTIIGARPRSWKNDILFADSTKNRRKR